MKTQVLGLNSIALPRQERFELQKLLEPFIEYLLRLIPSKKLDSFLLCPTNKPQKNIRFTYYILKFIGYDKTELVILNFN